MLSYHLPLVIAFSIRCRLVPLVPQPLALLSSERLCPGSRLHAVMLTCLLHCRQRISFVWGGCMLFPSDALKKDVHGIVKVWQPEAHRAYCEDGNVT